VIFQTLQNLAVLYNNTGHVNDRVALLSAVCGLSDLKQFKKAGFIFNGDYDYDYAKMKSKKKKFIPAYADESILSLRENEKMEKKEFFCKVIRWALSQPNLFQHSNMPLLKKSFFFFNFQYPLFLR
jgi:hypothetical protein